MSEAPAPTVVSMPPRQTVVSRAKEVQVVTQRVTRTVVSERAGASGRGGVVSARGGATPERRQIYNQATAPGALAGYTLLWFKSGVSADPNDREMVLIE